MNIFKDAATKIRNSYIIIPIVMVFILMFIVSCALMYEDYTTSRLGYLALPTHKANDWVVPLVAILPQLGQAGFGFVFMSDTNKRWAASIAAILWVLDVYTDVVYKAAGLGTIWVFGATVETIVIYSIGSEIMLATSVGMMAYTFKDFFRQLDRLMNAFVGHRRVSYQNSQKPRPVVRPNNTQPIRPNQTKRPSFGQYSTVNPTKPVNRGATPPAIFPFMKGDDE